MCHECAKFPFDFQFGKVLKARRSLFVRDVTGGFRLTERVRFLRQRLVTTVADGLGIMPVRHMIGLRGARCTGIGEARLAADPVFPGSAGPSRVGMKVPSDRRGAPKGERPLS
jgi:hypothetical protein